MEITYETAQKIFELCWKINKKHRMWIGNILSVNYIFVEIPTLYNPGYVSGHILHSSLTVRFEAEAQELLTRLEHFLNSEPIKPIK